MGREIELLCGQRGELPFEDIEGSAGSVALPGDDSVAEGVDFGLDFGGGVGLADGGGGAWRRDLGGDIDAGVGGGLGVGTDALDEGGGQVVHGGDRGVARVGG